MWILQNITAVFLIMCALQQYSSPTRMPVEPSTSIEIRALTGCCNSFRSQHGCVIQSVTGSAVIPCLRLRGANSAKDNLIQSVDLDGPAARKHRQRLMPWQKRRRRPRPRDHRISPVNSPFARVLPTDRRERPSYEERRRRLLGSYADAHARAIAELAPAEDDAGDTGAAERMAALLDEDRCTVRPHPSPLKRTQLNPCRLEREASCGWQRRSSSPPAHPHPIPLGRHHRAAPWAAPAA
jgi:hypothetical protein